MKTLLTISLALVFVIACDSGGGSEPGPDTTPGVDTTTPPDTTTSPDTASVDATPDVPDVPTPFMVGTAEALLPAPLGIPICGNMPDITGGSKTPYCANFPGTETIYLHPTIRAIALAAAEERLLLIRADLLAVRPSLIHAVEEGLAEATGDDWAGRVFIGATHTHSSAARLMPGLIEGIMMDEFFPQLFWRVSEELVALGLSAIADQEPGAVGYGELMTDLLHNDRRCENPPLQDDRLRILRFDGADGELKALLMLHSLHGTIIGSGDLHFSRDASGGVEEKVREAFDHPVTVMLWQAGGGDMSPDSAAEPPVEGLALGHDYYRIEGLGDIARDLVGGLVPDIATSSEVDLAVAASYVRIDREVMGYAEGEFPYEGGGAYCEISGVDQCYDPDIGWNPVEGLDHACLDVEMFLGEGIPKKFYASAFRIGEVLVVSYPGEPVTACTLEVEENIKAMFPEQEIMVVGYAQDYTGYSTPEEDWWQGAYEASGALWGPKQGDYITARVSELGLSLLDPEGSPLPFEAAAPYEIPESVSAWNVSVSVTVGTVVTEPADVAAGEMVTFEFTGGDPWLLLPAVVLEREDGGEWGPVTWPWGGPVDGAGYEYLVSMQPDPDYAATMTGTKRVFTWRVDLPTRRHSTPGYGELDGTYRFHVTGLQRDADTLDVEPYEVTSGAFTVTP